MASELRVNTLKDASGNNSIGMSLLQGAVQSRGHDRMALAQSLHRDSFNVVVSLDNGQVAL